MTDTTPAVIVVEQNGSTQIVDLVADIDVVTVTVAPAIQVIEVVTGGGGGGGGPTATATALSASPNPSTLGQNVTFTATVTAAGLPVTSGLVQFKSNGVNVGASVPVNLLGIAALGTSALTGASQSVTATFLANALFAGSVSAPVTQVVVSPPTTTTVLASSDTTTESGDSVTFTATVTRAGAVSVGAVGTVTFKRGTNAMVAGVAVSGGVATFTTSALPVGSWAITATYDGVGVYQPSTSNTVTQDVTLAGGPAPTTAALSSDDASSMPGQPVTFTVTVTTTGDGISVNSGTVAFNDGASVMISGVAVNPANGRATYTTSSLSTATHTITAEFTGAPVYAPATSNAVTQIVAAGSGGSPISQELVASKLTALPTEVVTICSTVRTSGSAPVSFGTVTFMEGATVIGVGPAQNIFGESEITITDLAAGVHVITAHYDGAPDYESDVSSPVTITVTATPPAPSPSDWAGNFASGSLEKITAWFDYNTGHLAEGFDPADLWNPAGVGSNAQVLVTPAWLAANEGPNVVNDGGGHWTITGLYSTSIENRTSHITLNHAWIHRVDYANVWGAGFAVRDMTLTGDQYVNVTNTDMTLNYCTISTDGSSSDSTYGDAVLFDPANAVQDDLTFNYCEVTQWRAGFMANFGMTANYSWVHDMNLFGADPHNTSGSIRGRQCRFRRNLFTDGTSSDVSLYADNNPYTEFWVTENTMWVIPSHASQEVNFPVRGTGWSPLLPGYVREFNDNKLVRGIAGDNQYWSKVTGNTLVTGEPLFGGGTTVQIADTPTLLAGASTGIQAFGASPTLTTYRYTPSPSSVQITFHAIGRAGTSQVPNVTLADESGAAWTVIPGTETPIEPGPGNNTIYGLSGSVWKTTTTATAQAFRRLTIDPYLSTSNAYMAALVVEITGLATLTLAQAPRLSAAGHDLAFGDTLPSITSGVLAANATAGNVVLLFVARIHEDDDMLTAPPGWHVLGNNFDPRASAACLWRDDFTGRSVTIPDLGASAGTAVTILMEVVMP